MWLGIAIAVIYGAVAVAANFVNKLAVQLLPLPTTILLIQTFTAVGILQLMAAFKLIKVPRLNEIQVERLAPLTGCYTLHAILVLHSLAFLSVPMYNTLKRLTPVMVLATKAVTDKRWPQLQTTLSVLLIVSGCLVAGAGDLSFDFKGYLMALMASCMQAAYVLLAERASHGKGGASSAGSKEAGAQVQDDELKALVEGVQGHEDASTKQSSKGPSDSGERLSATELLYSLSVISIPPLLALCVVVGEATRAPNLLMGLLSELDGPKFMLWLSITAVTNGLLTGSVILCTQMNSALTTSIVGVLKGAVSSVLGFFLLGGVKFHALNVVGITMNMAGGVWYSAYKYIQRHAGG